MTETWGPPVGTPLELDLNEPGWDFDLPPGRYLVAVDAQWDDAQAQFWLPIQILEAGSPSPTQPVPSVVPPGVTETRIAPGAWHLVVEYDSVWIAGINGVTRVNAATGQVEAEIEVPHADESDITAGAGHVWVTADASIVGIDATTNEIDKRFEIQTGIREIVFANDRLYVGHSAEGNGDLSEIDPTTGAFGRSILTGGPGLGESDILATNDAIWVGYSSPASGQTPSGLVRVEPDLSRADPVAGVEGVFSLAEADGFVWAVGTEEFYKVDAGGTLVATFRIPLAGKVASDADRLWLLLNTGSTSETIYLPDPNVPARVVEVDTVSGALLGEGTALPHDVPANIAVADGRVWVSFYEGGALVGVDTV
jgi:DNA-binding beta-propeller fold protein YncE